MMEIDGILRGLEAEGYRHVFLWRDRPNAGYPDHTHPTETAHVVLEGEITITADGITTTCAKGSRFDVPAGQVHSARIGPAGCRFVVGER